MAAEALRKRQPLKLTKAEADRLDRAVKGDIPGKLRRKYDTAVTGRPHLKRFSQLDCDVQTVIMSIAWQKGPNLNKPGVAPKFWKFVTDQDWEMAYKELMNFGDNHGPRRRAEAVLPKKFIDKNEKIP